MTLQIDYTADELLASHDYAEPLFAGGVRCHGGFADDGTYVSPRTKHRVPAIEAWQQQHRDQFGTELLGLPLDTWPESYPNVRSRGTCSRKASPSRSSPRSPASAPSRASAR